MTHERMIELINQESGGNFAKNIDLSGYNYYLDNDFICFKQLTVEGVKIVNIKYIYSENNSNLRKLIAYAANYWMRAQVKFIYYKEKNKADYALDFLKTLGFIILKELKPEWKYPFECKKCSKTCECCVNEAYT